MIQNGRRCCRATKVAGYTKEERRNQFLGDFLKKSHFLSFFFCSFIWKGEWEITFLAEDSSSFSKKFINFILASQANKALEFIWQFVAGWTETFTATFSRNLQTGVGGGACCCFRAFAINMRLLRQRPKMKNGYKQRTRHKTHFLYIVSWKINKLMSSDGKIAAIFVFLLFHCNLFRFFFALRFKSNKLCCSANLYEMHGIEMLCNETGVAYILIDRDREHQAHCWHKKKKSLMPHHRTNASVTRRHISITTNGI